MIKKIEIITSLPYNFNNNKSYIRLLFERMKVLLQQPVLTIMQPTPPCMFKHTHTYYII